jgi:tetratricopeptide (TPR) repeat protein
LISPTTSGRAAAKTPPAGAPPVAGGLAKTRTLDWALPLCIVLITGVSFAPVLQNQFVNWDDPVNLLDNPAYRGLGWEQLRWSFTTFHNSLYRPLTWITLGADYVFWGMQPRGYHLTSLLLHCAASLCFYFLALRLLALAVPTTGGPASLPLKAAAAFAALTFAVHPLRVEPIAWASGRENVVAAPFFILALVFYLRAVENPFSTGAYRKWLAAAWLAYLFSLLGKGAGVTLPIGLVILDFYPLKRLGGNLRSHFSPDNRRIWLEKLPFFFLALVFGLLAIYGKQQSKLMYGLEEYGIADRLVQTVYGVMFYLWKTTVPVDLSNLYEIEELSIYDWRFILSAVLIAGISAGAWLVRRRWPWLLAAWLWYVVILLPYVGVAQNGPQIAADRYSYLASLSWSAAAGAGVLCGWHLWRSGRIQRGVFLATQATAVLAIVFFGGLSWRQTQFWRDSETLWRHALAINDRSFFAHHFLGTALLAKGNPRAAIDHFNRSLALNPNYGSARAGLGSAFAERGELENAEEQFRQALLLDPDSMEVHYNLGRVAALRGDAEQAMTHYRRALELNPRDLDTHNNLGLLLAARGDAASATEHFQAALRIDPRYAKAHFNVGRVLAQQGRLDEAVAHFRRALEMEPEVPEIHEALGRALASQGNTGEAAKHLREAVRILKSRSAAPSQ